MLPATPRFELLAHNSVTEDMSVWKASPTVVGNHLLLRSGDVLYCIDSD